MVKTIWRHKGESDKQYRKRVEFILRLPGGFSEFERYHQRKYYAKHKVELAAKRRKYYEAHKVEVAERQRKYRAEHKVELAESGKKYYAEHKVELTNKRKHSA